MFRSIFEQVKLTYELTNNIKIYRSASQTIINFAFRNFDKKVQFLELVIVVVVEGGGEGGGEGEEGGVVVVEGEGEEGGEGDGGGTSS